MDPLTLSLTAASILSSLGGAYKASEANKKRESDLLAQRSDIDRELYTGALDSVGAQAYLKALNRTAERNLQGIDNGITAGGATAENALAQKQRLNETVSGAIENELQRKENAKRGYFHDRAALTSAINQGRAEQAQNWMTLAGNIASAGQSLGEAYLDDNSEKPYLSNREVKDFQPIEMEKANQRGTDVVKSNDNPANTTTPTPAVSPAPELMSPEEMRKRIITGQNG